MIAILGWLALSALAEEAPLVRLHPGYVTKITCPGRLLASAVGSDHAVKLEALPKELGCSVLLKPLSTLGRTNLLLETTAGSFTRILEVSPSGQRPTSRDLLIDLRGPSR